MKYKIFGKDRREGAIGVFESFGTVVEAPDEETARAKAREKRYAAGREHVHILETYLYVDREGA